MDAGLLCCTMGDLAAGDGTGDIFGFRGDGDRGDLDKMAVAGDLLLCVTSMEELTGAGDLLLALVMTFSDLELGDLIGRGVPGQSITRPSSGLLTSLRGLSTGLERLSQRLRPS